MHAHRNAPTGAGGAMLSPDGLRFGYPSKEVQPWR